MFIVPNFVFPFSAEDVRKLKNRVSSLESSAAAARTSRLSGSSNDVNAYLNGGGTSHTDNTLYLAGGGGGSSSKTRIGIVTDAGGTDGGNNVDISIAGGATGAGGSAGAGVGGRGSTGTSSSGGTSHSGSAGGTSHSGSASGTSHSSSASGTSHSGSAGTSHSGSAGTGYIGGAGSAETGYGGSAGTTYSGSRVGSTSFSGTGIGNGVSEGHIDAAALHLIVQNMLRTEMNSQAFRGTYWLQNNTDTQIHGAFLFIELLFCISGFIASSVQGERGLPGPKGEIQILI